MVTTHYSNLIDVDQTETEVVLYFKMKSKGKSAEQCRVVLSPLVAAKLWASLEIEMELELKSEDEKDENSPDVTI